jgi:hypothetical protein
LPEIVRSILGKNVLIPLLVIPLASVTIAC